MTHDPMCWLNEWGDLYKVVHPACKCDLIAQVRADERERCIAEVEALGPLQQFKTWNADDGYPLWGHEVVDVSATLRGQS